MRKGLLVRLAGCVLVATSLFPLTKSDAALTVQEEGPNAELIANTGFETGTMPWIVSGQAVRSTGTFAHSGTAYMILAAANSTSGTLYQTVTVPSAATPTLTFWLNITTSEPARAAGVAVSDRCFIEVRSTTGELLATLATFSDRDGGTAGEYVLRGPYRLGAFVGQTVRIQLRATEDISLPTSFRVDDVSVR